MKTVKKNREKLFAYADGTRFRNWQIKNVFNDIFQKNYWNWTGKEESLSGPGSSLAQTETIRRELVKLFLEFEIKSILDIPCGDFNWMQHVVHPELTYIGADIVEKLIEINKEKYTASNIQFLQMDLTKDSLPYCDLVICRDCLAHFSFSDIQKALKNIKASGCHYLLTSSFTDEMG